MRFTGQRHQPTDSELNGVGGPPIGLRPGLTKWGNRGDDKRWSRCSQLHRVEPLGFEPARWLVLDNDMGAVNQLAQGREVTLTSATGEEESFGG